MSNASNFVIENGVLKKYAGPGGDVVIPEGVLEIGKSAFAGCKELTGVTVPGSVTKIKETAFEDCSELRSAVIPESARIGDGAFHGCCALADEQGFVIVNGTLYDYVGSDDQAIVPDGVSRIGAYAFSKCSGLIRAELPGSVIVVDSFAFERCTGLKEIIISENVTGIGMAAFFCCSSLTEVTIPRSVTDISIQAFCGCSSLEKIEFKMPTGLRYIGTQAFAYCSSLTETSIPEGVKEIWNQAFQSCRGLKTLIIPESVTEIGDEAFANCENLTEATLPAGLETAGKGCFSFCDRLELVRVQNWTPAVSALLEKNKIKRIIAENFSSVPASRKLGAILGYLSERRSGKTEEIDKRIRSYLEKNACKLSATAFDEPELLAFLCDQRLIPATDVEAFLDEAEKRGDTEKKALLLDYQNRLGSGGAAKERAKQEKVKESYMSAALERAAARDPSKGIEGMTFVVGGKLSFWDSRKELQTYLEPYGAKLASSVTKQTDYLVTEESDGNSEKILKAQKLGVAIINEEELNHIIGRRFKDAVSIEVPGWIKRIESSAFTDCPSLTKVTISNGVTSISGFPFYGLCGLTDVTIPESVTSIGGNVFTKCPNVRIHAPSGSYAEQYAKEHNIPFAAE